MNGHPGAGNSLKLTRIRTHIRENLLIVAASMFVAILLAQSDFFKNIITATQGVELLAIFIAGFFFTSVFTTAPAIVAMSEIAKVNSPVVIALVGGLGALCGDLILLRFLKSHVTDELTYLLEHEQGKRFKKLFHLKAFRWMMTFLGGVIIASPLPDELGLFLMGVSKLPAEEFVVISYTFNALGIFVISVLARAI